MATLSQVVQPVISRELQITTSCPTGLSLCVQIERVVDGFFYDPSDETFKTLGSITNPDVSLTEDPAGSGEYNVSLDVTSWVDGNYETVLYDKTGGVTNTLDTDEVYVDGGTGAPVTSSKERVDHNFNGPDSLCYTTSSGDPISGAEIYIFEQVDYDATAGTLQAVAVTSTDSSGRWKDPVFLVPGTYVVYFYLKDQYGPDTVTITVV